MKVAIVGSEEKYWTREQERKAKACITTIFGRHAVIPNLTYADTSSADFSRVTLISGHCPRGGIDIWAEEIAKELGCYNPDYIYSPKVKRWEDVKIDFVVFEGYRSRNIKIAKVCDILYDIEPAGYFGQRTAIHRSSTGDKQYRRSGGTWTMGQARKMGKETHLVVI